MNDVAVAPPAIDDTELLRAGPGASWGAILAGSAVAASAAVLLLTLGAGLGFASISPWSDRGMSAGGLTVAGQKKRIIHERANKSDIQTGRPGGNDRAARHRPVGAGTG